VFPYARTRTVILSAAAALGTLVAASPALAAGSGASPGATSPGGSSPAGATSGGASLTPSSTGLLGTSPSSPSSSTSSGPSTSGNPIVQTGDGNVTVSASGAGITLSTVASALLRNQLTFTGTAPTSDAGRTIEIERLGHETNWTWQPTVQVTVGPQGTFSGNWSTDHIGEFEIRAVLGSSSGAQAADTASVGGTAPTVLVTVYRPSVASWYGPGMWNTRTACGVKLTRRTLGVANKTLKCGSKVALYYNGKTLVVPVIDRGPYANGADWDLTEATGQALGMVGAGVVTIGAVSLPTPPSTVAGLAG
jgi:hypothetical protein